MIAMVIFLVVASFVTYQFMVQMKTLNAVKAQDTAVHDQLNTAQAETAQLQQENKDSQTDSWVIRMAHEILGWVLPNEVKVVNQDK